MLLAQEFWLNFGELRLAEVRMAPVLCTRIAPASRAHARFLVFVRPIGRFRPPDGDRKGIYAMW